VTGRYGATGYSRPRPGITGWSRHLVATRTGYDRLRPAAARQSLCSTCVVAPVSDRATVVVPFVCVAAHSRAARARAWGSRLARPAGGGGHQRDADDDEDEGDRAEIAAVVVVRRCGPRPFPPRVAHPSGTSLASGRASCQTTSPSTDSSGRSRSSPSRCSRPSPASRPGAIPTSDGPDATALRTESRLR